MMNNAAGTMVGNPLEYVKKKDENKQTTPGTGVTCPKCGSVENGNFCSKCGTKLETVKYCNNCGEKVTGAFCSKCGTKVE